MEGTQNMKPEMPYDSVICLLGEYMKDSKPIYRSFLHVSGYCHTIHNSYIIEATTLNTNSGTNKENVVLTQNGILNSHKE